MTNANSHLRVLIVAMEYTPDVSGGVGTYVDGVGRLMTELDRDPTLVRRPNAGGIAHFVRQS